MFRFLVAFFAVCAFSLASVNVAEAGGGGGTAGGGKGGGKGELVIENASATETITVFYRVEDATAPMVAADIAALESVEVAPGATESVDLDVEMYELFVFDAATATLVNDPANAGESVVGLPVTTFDIEDDLVTTVTVDGSPGAPGGAAVTGVTGPE